MINEKWKCSFEIRNILLVNQFYRRLANQNNDNLKMEEVEELNFKNQFILKFANIPFIKNLISKYMRNFSSKYITRYIKGEIIIDVNPMTSKHRIYKQAYENLNIMIGLLYVRIGDITHRLIEPKVEVFDIKLINEEEIRNKNQRTHTDIKGHYEAEIIAVSYIENSNEISNIYNKLTLIDENIHKELKLSMRWFYQSVITSNQLDKFINAWLTFSMLYGWIAQNSALKNGIDKLIENSCPDENERKRYIQKNLDNGICQ